MRSAFPFAQIYLLKGLFLIKNYQGDIDFTLKDNPRSQSLVSFQVMILTYSVSG